MPSQFKNIEIVDTGYLTLPSGTSSERPSQPESGMIRYNTDLGRTEWYDSDDSEWKSLSNTFPRATGGTVVDTEINGRLYRLHYFTETGTDTLTVTAGGEVEYLIVAGGGGGGGNPGGGGGSGGLITGTTGISAQTYSIVVGDGGQGGERTGTTRGANGDNSSAFGLTAAGGGAGAYNADGNDGGSGAGGGGESSYNGGLGIQGSSASGGKGSDGGSSAGSNDNRAGGGGGGAGSQGNNGETNGLPGNGGQGILSLITGQGSFYAGGGSGGMFWNGGDGNPSQGGLGGGGAGGGIGSSSSNPSQNGSPNTGGGGGGGDAYEDKGGDGGSGIVIVRYPLDPDAAYSQPDRTISSTLPGNFNIIEDGLVFNVDPSSPVTYTGSGGVKDLISGVSGSFSSGSNFLDEYQGVFEFDGNNKGIDFGTGEVRDNLNRPSTELTVCAYFKTGAKSDQVLINNISYQNDHGWQVRTNSNDFIQLEITGYQPDGTKLVTDNQWHFVGITFKTDGQTKYYIDGVLEDTFSSPSDTFSDNTSVGVYIGGMDNYSRYWNGLIGPVWVYEKELSSQEIRHNFNVTRGRFGV